MAKSKRPSYLPEANRRVAEIKKHFEADLRGIAEKLASHEGTERVLSSHIDEAFKSLKTCGLVRLRFFRRNEFRVGAGGLLVGGAFALPTFASEWIPHLNGPAGKWACGAMAVVGLFLAIHGWIRGTP